MSGRATSVEALGKLLSVEVIASMLLTAFTVGGVYASLSAKANDSADKIEKQDQTLTVVQHDVAAIRTDIEVVKVQLKASEKDRERTDRLLGEILKELRDNGRD